MRGCSTRSHSAHFAPEPDDRWTWPPGTGREGPGDRPCTPEAVRNPATAPTPCEAILPLAGIALLVVAHRATLRGKRWRRSPPNRLPRRVPEDPALQTTAYCAPDSARI